MNRPSYMKIGYCRGYCKETKEWIYGWHWTDTPYVCFYNGEKTKHFIRVQINHDWNLTEQKDYEVESESIGYYIGRNDSNNVPLFLGDKVYFTKGRRVYEGRIGYMVEAAAYCILGSPYGVIVDFSKISNIEVKNI